MTLDITSSHTVVSELAIYFQIPLEVGTLILNSGGLPGVGHSASFWIVIASCGSSPRERVGSIVKNYLLYCGLSDFIYSYNALQNWGLKLGVAVQACNSNTVEAEAGGFWVWVLVGQDPASKKKKKEKKNEAGSNFYI
jgi:hypothetical protein